MIRYSVFPMLLLVSACATAELPGREATATIGDPIPKQGWLSERGSHLEFRGCNSEDLYLIEASLAVEDQLYALLTTRSKSGPVYVRFRGKVVDSTSLDERYAGVLVIIELDAAGSAAPGRCR